MISSVNPCMTSSQVAIHDSLRTQDNPLWLILDFLWTIRGFFSFKVVLLLPAKHMKKSSRYDRCNLFHPREIVDRINGEMQFNKDGRFNLIQTRTLGLIHWCMCL